MIEDIEKARLRLGISQSELARRARRSPSTYSKALKGRFSASEETLSAFLAAIESIAAEQEIKRERLSRIGQPQTERNAA